MKYDLIFVLWLYVTIVSSYGANTESDEIMMGRGLYMETKDLHRRKIGPPTKFGSTLKSSDQLANYKNSHPNIQLLTQSMGIPVGDNADSLTVGPLGPMLLQDAMFLDEMSHFGRERIPERVVHAKGTGAFGYFEVTHDITQYTKAVVFSKVGKRTDIAVRFSTVAGEMGSADTVRDPRGFAIKFYTEQGNWDLTGNNTPIFFVRDTLLFPHFIHSQKRNPATHQKDANAFWDFITLEPETVHQVMYLFSDRGIPNGHRHMNGYGSHTFKMVNASGHPIYCKFHYKTDQGVEGLETSEAAKLAGTTPDYAIQDLYDAIANKDYPSWTFSIQVMTFKQAEEFRFNPFDLTKVWPHAEYPLIPVGRFVLNRNPTNYFAQVEQLAFNPASMIPGIEPSPDKMLQGRLFSYGDTHRYRLGPNFQQIPVNCPYRTKVRNYQRDGLMTVTDNGGGSPNYFPNSFSGPVGNPEYLQSRFHVSGDVARYNSTVEDNFAQPTLLWTKVLQQPERERLVNNIAGHVINAEEFIQERVIKLFQNVHLDLGQQLRSAILKLRMQKVFKEWNFVVPEMEKVFAGFSDRYNTHTNPTFGHFNGFTLYLIFVSIFILYYDPSAVYETSQLLTEASGISIGNIADSLTVGPQGPMLLQDVMFFDELSHFARERIPERVVHAKAAGAFGYFEVTNDITQYTKAVVFGEIGKRTNVSVRLSTVVGESGSADTVRDLIGFAIKFYTEEGNWDLLTLNSPVFAVRDSLMFPHFIHSQKKNPSTHQMDYNAIWDFFTLMPESVHHIMKLFSDTAIPSGFQHIDGHAVNTFKLVNGTGNPVYCKFHLISDQGVEALDPDIAAQLAGIAPDYHTKDLYDAIANKSYPSWTFYIQVMTFEQAEQFRWNPFDATKLWPEDDVPFLAVGKLVLNRNPVNYFAEVEQLAFQAANMIPGIEPSPDKLLQGRLFIYGDTQRHRLGPNFQQIPVNCPLRTKVRNYQRDGLMTVTDNLGNAPNYYPNSFGGPVPNSAYLQSSFEMSGNVDRYNSTEDDNFSQPTLLWTERLNATQRQSLVNNIAASVVNAAPFIQTRAIDMFTNVHPDFGDAVCEAIQKLESQ